MNLAETIIPKSDQLNADDLIAGPKTIRIAAVEGGSQEQPVIIRYDGDDGHPYKPSKGMRRVLVTLWGTEGSAYVGKRLTLYNDPSVTFGPAKTGGIRISHADIPERVEIALTMRKGLRKPFIVEPLPPPSAPAPEIDLQTLSDIGDTKAREGLAALQSWWKTLTPKAQAKLKPTLDSSWKSLAADADARKS